MPTNFNIGMQDVCMHQGRQKLEIIHPNPTEVLLSTPVDLPTTEPTTGQITFTVTENDFPKISGKYFKTAFNIYAYIGGKNTSTSSLIVYCKGKQNGTDIAIGSASVAAGYFYTVNFCYFVECKPGDTFEFRLWASGVGINYDYYAYQVHMRELSFGRLGQVFKNVQYEANTFIPNLTLGNPTYSTYYFYAYPLHYVNSTGSRIDSWGIHPYDGCVVPCFTQSLDNRGIPSAITLNLGVGGGRTVTVYTSPTYRPYYLRTDIPRIISFNPTPILCYY